MVKKKKLTACSGSGWDGDMKFGSGGGDIGSKTSHLYRPIKTHHGWILNFNSKSNQIIHLLIQNLCFLQNLLNLISVKLVDFIELIIKSPKINKLVLSSVVGGHQESGFVTVRSVSADRVDQD